MMPYNGYSSYIYTCRHVRNQKSNGHTIVIDKISIGGGTYGKIKNKNEYAEKFLATKTNLLLFL